jgi:CRISPR-associated protein Cas1
MGTLYIDRKDLHIRLDGNAIAFYSNGQREGVVPINPLKRVVIVGSLSIETQVLRRLADGNISVVFLSGKRLRFSGMLHGRLHNNGILRVKQYEKSLSEFPAEFSKDLVIKKITAQLQLLEYAAQTRHDLRLALTSSIKTLQGVLISMKNPEMPVETIRGMEGGASAAYFAAYTKLFADSLDFKGRNRRPPEDPVNALLSLCYTLVHFEMVREIETIGLDPTIGFYHQFDYGRESLACDLVENYRPAVDKFVYELFRDREFTARDFATDDERPGCYLKKQRRKDFYPLYEQWANEMRLLWREEVRNLSRRIMDGQDTLSE